MHAGFARRDITPDTPMALGGFAARCGKPFTAIDDPLHVRALAVSDGETTVVVLVYDLLGFDRERHDRIRSNLRARWPGTHFVLAATHAHSGPVTMPLVGEAPADERYLAQVERAGLETTEAALAGLRPACLRAASLPMPGQSYNRRQVLEDGRVTMAGSPDDTVVECGPVWEDMCLLRLEGEDGAGICGMIHWAAHAVTVCGPHVSADFPGELCRRLGELYGFPFLYLQGPCGNTNPPFRDMTRQEMLENVEALERRIRTVVWSETAKPVAHVRFRAATLDLEAEPLAPEEELQALRSGLAAVAESGAGPEATLRILADILNVPPGEPLEPELSKHIARMLCLWTDQALAARRREADIRTPLQLAVLGLDSVLFAFIGAEPFVETGLQLQQAFPGRTVLPVGYAGPVVGYLPDTHALDLGGYEVDYAYRFYGQPAPFARDTEARVRHALSELLASVAPAPP